MDGPPLTKNQVKVYETWKTPFKVKASIIANIVNEEKRVMIEEYAQITK